MRRLKNILLFLLLGAMTLHAQDKPAKPTVAPWQEKTATARIRFTAFSRRSPVIFVPVPTELADSAKNVVAIDDRGTHLEAFPFFKDGKLLGAAVNAAKLAAPSGQPPNLRLNASLYLLLEPPKEKAAWSAPSVRVSRHGQSLTTRAFTAEEMLRLYANLKPRRNFLPPSVVTTYGAIPDSNPRWQSPPEMTYGVSVFIWEALWNVEKQQAVRFGGDQTHVAWTVLLDGRPVANWHATEGVEIRKDGGNFGAAVDVAPGLHALQFLAVQCLQQPIPKLLVKDAQDKEGAGQPPTNLFPMQRPFLFGVEINGHPEASVIGSIYQDQAYYFQQTNQTAVTYRTPPDGKTTLLPYGMSIQTPVNQNLAVCAHADYPTVQLKAASATYTFPGFARWMQGIAANFHAHVGDLTPLVRHGDPLKGDIRVQWPESIPPNIRNLLKFNIQQEKADGSLAAPSTIQADGTADMFAFSLAIEDDTAAIVFTPDFAGIMPFPPVKAKIHRSKDASLNITAQGTALYENGNSDACRVAFIMDPLPDAPPEPMETAYPESLFILDDFIATANAPQANLLPETLMAEYFQHTPLTQITHAAVHCPPGTDDFIAIPANLSTLTGLKPKIAVLAIGYEPLKAGLSPLDATQQILFAAQACRVNGIQPVFVTLPPLPEIDPETSRLTALYLKESALRTNTPIIDLYAQAMMDHVNTGEWRLADTIAIPTLNNTGRIWVIQKITSRLMKLFK
ncbi:MAG: hypothetical protein IKZ46_13330 [Victivallales bacterium]|nr:hypothetical protein [Victivallales bacterium]